MGLENKKRKKFINKKFKKFKNKGNILINLREIKINMNIK